MQHNVNQSKKCHDWSCSGCLSQKPSVAFLFYTFLTRQFCCKYIRLSKEVWMINMSMPSDLALQKSSWPHVLVADESWLSSNESAQCSILFSFSLSGVFCNLVNVCSPGIVLHWAWIFAMQFTIKYSESVFNSIKCEIKHF